MQVVIAQLAGIVTTSDAQIGDMYTWPPRVKDEVAKWLSDFHLVSYLCMQGILSLVSGFQFRKLHHAHHSQEEQQLLCRAATAHAHPKDTRALDLFFNSDGWRTLLTIVESSACEYIVSHHSTASPS